MKTYHFLAGLPRSGNTLLSSILNQNPRFYSSPLSPVVDYLGNMYNIATQNFHINNTQDVQGSHNALQKFIHNYYEHIDKPVIFDREKTWGTPKNYYNILTYITDKPKIIFTERPMPEILASFIVAYGPRLNELMDNAKWNWKSHLTENDNKCDFLMSSSFELDKILNTYTTIKNYPDSFHIVQYHDLTTKPQETLQKIYDFLGEEYYEHDFANVIRLETYTETNVGLPIDFHKVRPVVEKNALQVESVLSDYAITKYTNY